MGGRIATRWVQLASLAGWCCLSTLAQETPPGTNEAKGPPTSPGTPVGISASAGKDVSAPGGGGAGAGGPFIPPQATVVLVSGIPGDIESEKAYHDQLQAWLEMVENGGQAKRILVLADSPELVVFGGQTEAKVSKADREHFVTLSKELAGTTNPVVVITWGHGGRQGETPVFHVRGPRLTPTNFTALASAVETVESRWVLLFRNSGAFARALAGPGRQILSSECDTSFTSDPVGMSVLLKLVKGNPGISFGQLAEDFGRGTAGWYTERNLARTEEPTLWLPNEKPRLLAPATGDEAAVAKLETGTNAPPVKPSAAKTPTPGAATNELAGYWKDLKRVEKYPEADGVILKQRLNCTLGSEPALTTETEEFIQILTPEGKQFGDFDVSYAPPAEEVSFEVCEVLGPDGKVSKLEPDAIRDAGEHSVGQYPAQRRKFFSLPGVVPGAVVHVHYRTQWKEFPLPHVSLEMPVGSELPVVESTVQVSVPKEAAFHFAFEGIAAPEPIIKETSYSKSYAWNFMQVPAHRHEILTAPGQQARLLLSTFADWKAFAEWYGRISKLTDEVTPEIAAKAKELTRDAKTDQEKVLAVYNYVTSLRYVAIPLGVNSFRPHAAANVLQNQFGDCKDKANLFNALLHAVELDAHLVLVPRFRQAREAIPGLAFNHAISRVTLGGQAVWVDTTDDVCRFGLLPPGDPGRKVLVIDGRTETLTQLPAPEAKEHELKLHGELSWGDRTNGLPVTLGAVARGYPDYELREAAREVNQQRASLPLLTARFRPVAGTFALEKQTATAVSALAEDFSWQAEGTCVGLCSVTGNRWLMHAPFWLPREWDLALHHRRAPLFLNQGYPLTLSEEFELKLPDKVQTVVLPGVVENTQEPLQWRVEWTRVGDDKLLARMKAELARGELTAAETPVFQRQLRELLEALGADVTFGR
jgi:hypothetical protein